MATTLNDSVDNTYTQLTSEDVWFIQVVGGGATLEVFYSDTAPAATDRGILVRVNEAISSSIMPGTVWARSVSTTAESEYSVTE